MDLSDIITLKEFPLANSDFQKSCKKSVDQKGALILEGFLLPDALEQVRQEGLDNKHKAYYCTEDHNVYLTDPDPDFSMEHPRNRQIVSSKGCITDDQMPLNSPLHVLYDCDIFRNFLCEVLGEEGLYDYADSLSSINLHYAGKGKELGWHFDNSSFATTLLIQKPDAGGVFEYVEDMRDADKGEMNFEGVNKVLDGKTNVKTMNMSEGTLALFRGRNAIHRVTPTQGDTTRMLVVLAYNSKPNVAISESASMTFYGRIS